MTSPMSITLITVPSGSASPMSLPSAVSSAAGERVEVVSGEAGPPVASAA
ncbi:hypothetical protein SAMN05216199_2293 [Pedococcus cremeus]|uniref:Uncharacterized protein n=1 Tax=Pedococcus cremeus TaxID=587636 RepID=A0A1H9V437_9MICO|nr:hypothetical protein SAMN05216199_2293 [Pedococcus cremeus]